MAAINLSPAGFPMAPSQEVWDALTPDERRRVVDSLPGEVTDAEIAPASHELIAQLMQVLEDLQQRADEETRHREEAEIEVARLREELARFER